MSLGSSLSGLLEFGVNTPPDMASTRSGELVSSGNKASFKKSLDQAAQQQRQQTSAKSREDNSNETASSSGTRPASTKAEAASSSSASAGSAQGESDSHGESSLPIENRDVSAAQTPPSTEGASIAGRTAIVGEATLDAIPLDPDASITIDLEADVGLESGAELLILNTPTDVTDIESMAGAVIGADLDLDLAGEVPLVPGGLVSDPHRMSGERQAQAAVLTVSDRMSVFTDEEAGPRLPRSIQELRFSEFVQSQTGDVTPANAMMGTPAPSLSATMDSKLLFDENMLTLQTDTEWVVDEATLALSPSNKPVTPLPAATVATADTQRISVPVNVVFGNERWQQLAAERTVTLLQQGVKSAELMLDPPELGPLQVRIQMQNDQAVIHFTSASAAVRDALDQTFPRLREMLQEQGVELLQADVSDQSSQEGADGGHDSDRNPLVSREAEAASELMPDPVAQPQTLILNAGIDDFA